jgi:CheY-like chemotaxis protein
MGATLNNATLLHIEDDAAVIKSMAQLCRTIGYETTGVASRASALAALQKGLRPAVLLVDYHLASPETGTDVAEEVMQWLGYTVPAILLTADLANVEVPWMPGAPLLLASKPMHPGLLVETVEHFAALHQAQRAYATALANLSERFPRQNAAATLYRTESQ